MRKTALFLVIIIVLALTATACGKNEEPSAVMEPQESQMRAICELAVMDCYYHNVAKYYEKDAEKGFLGLGSKDKHFWIEYSGVVTLGIDVSLVTIEINGTNITITLPKAEVMGCRVDSSSLSPDSFIVDKDSADITGEDEIKAFEAAQTYLEENAANNRALLQSAQDRAQSLLSEYVLNIGNAVGKQYSITWVYLDDTEMDRNSPISDTTTPTE